MYQKVHKNLFFRFLFSFISILLIFLLIMNSSIIDCFAVAGVDDALLLLLVSIMGACGITFSSTLLANQAADSLYDSSPPDLQKIFDAKASELVVLGAFGSAGITFLAEQWTQITQSVINTFGDFTGIDVRLKLSGDLTLSSGGSLKTEISVGSAGHSQYVADTFVYDFYGRNFDFSKAPDFINNIHSSRPSQFIIAMTIANSITLVCNTYNTSNASLSLTSSLSYTNGNQLMFNSRGVGTSIPLYINGDACTLVSSGTGYVLQNSSGSNVISGGILVGTDVPVPDSICPDGIFTKNSDFSDWISGLINGTIGSVGALPGDPGIDVTSYPGNDTWHDGIDDVGSVPGSIGIAVPGDINDVIDYSPDLARDISNVDVSDSDIADTDTDTSDKTDTDNDTPSITKPGGLPAMSLPEVLFKEKFPFCLPWDLYNVFVILNAEPVAPKFDIPFKLERLGIDYVFTIDLSDYEQFALISRVSLSITFIIALILLSRKVIGA